MPVLWELWLRLTEAREQGEERESQEILQTPRDSAADKVSGFLYAPSASPAEMILPVGTGKGEVVRLVNDDGSRRLSSGLRLPELEPRFPYL